MWGLQLTFHNFYERMLGACLECSNRGLWWASVSAEGLGECFETSAEEKMLCIYGK